jgi:hypothetical protein
LKSQAVTNDPPQSPKDSAVEVSGGSSSPRGERPKQMTRRKLKREVGVIFKKAQKEKSKREMKDIAVNFDWMKGSSPTRSPVFVGPSDSLSLVKEPWINPANNNGEDAPSVTIPATSVDGNDSGACAFPAINANDDNSETSTIPDASIEDTDSCIIDLRPVTSAVQVGQERVRLSVCLSQSNIFNVRDLSKNADLERYQQI